MKNCKTLKYNFLDFQFIGFSPRDLLEKSLIDLEDILSLKEYKKIFLFLLFCSYIEG
jgi:hypothetical protein